MAQPTLFGLVPAGLPVMTQPSETLSETSFVYTIPTSPVAFSHVTVFLLPGVILPANTAAAIYLVTPPDPARSHEGPTSCFLGGIGPGKESAIFRFTDKSTAQVILGVSVEAAASVAGRIAELQAAKSSTAMALMLGPQRQQVSTLVLAQRIIKNAFNFLASFSGQAGQVEVVPLKAFEDWWRKFESKVRADPGFLEKDDS